jgi:hypothetical protein
VLFHSRQRPSDSVESEVRFLDGAETARYRREGGEAGAVYRLTVWDRLRAIFFLPGPMSPMVLWPEEAYLGGDRSLVVVMSNRGIRIPLDLVWWIEREPSWNFTRVQVDMWANLVFPDRNGRSFVTRLVSLVSVDRLSEGARAKLVPS